MKILVVLVVFWVSVVANCPFGIIKSGVTEEDKQVIIDAHNKVRLQIAKGTFLGQPRGVNLKRMSWDDCLAEEAQRIAETCEFKHKKATCPDSFEKIGQNLHNSRSNKPRDKKDWEQAVQDWVDENELYTYGNEHIKGTGHYTQVIWANSSKIGCGWTYYEKAHRFHQLYVCNYGPAGNIKGQYPYEKGASGCENLC